MMLAMFAGKNREDWDDLLPAVMMAYRSSVHESTGFSPYRLMFGEECTLPMDIGLPKQQWDSPDSITSPYAIWVRLPRLFAVGDWVMRYYTPAKKCKLDSAWIGPYMIVSLIGWALGIQKDSESPIVIVHCQDIKKVSAGGRVLVTNEAIIGCSIGSDPRCQYYATNVAEFTFVNGGGPGRRNKDCRGRFGPLG